MLNFSSPCRIPNASRPQVESHPQVGKRKLGERSKDKWRARMWECNNFLDLSPWSITPLVLNLLRTKRWFTTRRYRLHWTRSVLGKSRTNRTRLRLGEGRVRSSVTRGAVADSLCLKCRTYLAKKRYVGIGLCLRRELRLKTH